MNLVKIGIDGLIAILGQSDLFDRIIHQIQRINQQYPDHPGDDKRIILLKDLEVILGEFSKSLVNLLIELGVTYLKSLPAIPDVVDPILDSVADKIEDKVTDAIDGLENIQS